ncbi:MAG: FecR family protein [Planctomycetota bacterium]
MNRPDHEIDAFLEGTLTADQARVLEAWINASHDKAAEFLHLARTHQMLDVIGKENRLNREANQTAIDAPDPVFLTSLAKMEAEAQTEYLCSPDQTLPFETNASRRDEVTLSKAMGELCWAAGKVGYRLVRSKAVITGVAAAVILIGLLLISPWKDSTAPGPADGPHTDNATPASTKQVAILTDQQNARWKVDGLKIGDQLYAGQQLELLTGSAEITTKRGARSVLEAPCTVELIDHDNALRLINGKIVVICDTDFSKGFVVRTPHVDITDLGTRFGVDVTNDLNTEVHVYEGEVVVSMPDFGPGSVVIKQDLTAGQAATASKERGIESVEEDPSRFAALSPTIIPLPGTGKGLAADEKDPRWTITEIDGQFIAEPKHPEVWWQSGLSESGSKPNDPETSQWIGLARAYQEKPKKSYVFQTEIDLPKTLPEAMYRLDIDFAVDNQINSVRVNGRSVPFPEHGLQDFALQSMVIDQHLRAGTNVIEVEIINHRMALSRSPVGLRLEWRALLLQE